MAPAPQAVEWQRELLDGYLAEHSGKDLLSAKELLLWYLTPMSLSFTEHLKARVTIFDCMDELSAFKGAPSDLLEKERQLMDRADVVFTGGYSLWEAKNFSMGTPIPCPAASILHTLPRPVTGFQNPRTSWHWLSPTGILRRHR